MNKKFASLVAVAWCWLASATAMFADTPTENETEDAAVVQARYSGRVVGQSRPRACQTCAPACQPAVPACRTCAPVCQTCAQPSCCVEKHCVPTTEMKKIPHNCYCCRLEDFCLPRISFHGLSHQSCEDCCAAQPCCRLFTKKLLIKRVVIEEKCVPKCEVEVVPTACCEQTPCCTNRCKLPCVNSLPLPKK